MPPARPQRPKHQPTPRLRLRNPRRPRAAPAPAEAPAVETGSVAEAQLKAQGDTQEVENFRQIRERLREAQAAALRQQEAAGELPFAPLESTLEPDGAAAALSGDDRPRRFERAGRDRDDDQPRARRRALAAPDEEVLEEFGQRFIVRRGDQLMICQDEEADTERLLYRARDVEVEPLRGGRTRTTVHRADGTMIVTERDRFGAVISRTRIDADGERFVLFDDSEFQRDEAPRRVTLFEDELPPLEVDIPREEYVVETRQANRRAIRRALEAPLVEEAERVYSRDEVRSSRRLRDKVRRIDLNTITFDFGSAALSPSQFRALRVVSEAIEQVLEDRPYEVFLIEGHTDAVGTEYANLLLSDRRAEAVAIALSSNFDIPPENLVTQGYGQQYLKIDTQRPERENRRVAVRRITELVRAER